VINYIIAKVIKCQFFFILIVIMLVWDAQKKVRI
jgi:hypothetical protein